MHALNRCFSWSLNPWLGIVCLPRDLHRDRGISADAVLAGAVDAVVFVGEVFEGEIEGDVFRDFPAGVERGGEVARGAVGGDALGVGGGEIGKVVLFRCG